MTLDQKRYEIEIRLYGFEGSNAITKHFTHEG